MTGPALKPWVRDGETGIDLVFPLQRLATAHELYAEATMAPMEALRLGRDLIAFGLDRLRRERTDGGA